MFDDEPSDNREHDASGKREENCRENSLRFLAWNVKTLNAAMTGATRHCHVVFCRARMYRAVWASRVSLEVTFVAERLAAFNSA
jgi:hypothetical protein